MGLVFSWLWGQRQAPPLLDVVTETQAVPSAEPPLELPVESEDVPVQSVEIPKLPEVITHALAEESSLTHAKELMEEALVEDFIMTESASVVESAIAESVPAEEETMTITEETQVVLMRPTEPDVPAEDVALDAAAAAEETCMEKLSEEPKPQICDMAHQMQLAVESVQLNSVEMSLDTTLNAHMVQEVPIEG